MCEQSDLTKLSELSKIRWHCRRGMRELDTVLSNYFEECYPEADKSERLTFKTLLELEDPRLYALLLGYEDTENIEQKHLVIKLRSCLI